MSVTPESAPQRPYDNRPPQQHQQFAQPYQQNPQQRYSQPQYPQQHGTQPQYLPQRHHVPRAGAELARPVPGAVAQQRPTGLAMKKRNPVAAWLGLPLITLGIYSLVWYYKIHREMAEFDRRRSVPVAGPMLVLLFLSWTFVAPLVSFYNTGTRIAVAQRAAGLHPTCNPLVGLLLCFVFGLQVLYYQVELNKIGDAYGVPEGTEIALRG